MVLAIDHRANLLENLNQHAPSPIDDGAFTHFKQQILRSLTPLASAVLTDPAYGIGAGIAGGVIRDGLLAPLEVTDYSLHPSQRGVNFIPAWSVEKIKRAGGDGVKLLLPYHPDDEKREVIQQIIDDCARYDIPFYLEPIPYSPDPAQPLDNDTLLAVCVQAAQTYSAMGVDILKMPFPVDVKLEPDENNWLAACQAVDAACSVPWTLLSAGVDYATFARQAEVACRAGASGVIVGRAVWTEAVALQGEARQQFIQTTARERMDSLAAICQQHAQPWQQRTSKPASDIDWYFTY